MASVTVLSGFHYPIVSPVWLSLSDEFGLLVVISLKGEKSGVFDAFGDVISDGDDVKRIDIVMFVVWVKHSKQRFFIANDIIVDEVVV